ncbi:hypothetical protein [Mycobacterium sp. 050134]|uniref:hypothetical protein n=1 Tax=Mycobacterium sp. 050134 TaxID=3096111 RepID=UPI002ED8CF48
MKIWIQIRDQDDDDEYPDGATYEIAPGGVLKVTSGTDIHLYSPARWLEATIDSRPAGERAEAGEELNDELNWQ